MEQRLLTPFLGGLISFSFCLFLSSEIASPFAWMEKIKIGSILDGRDSNIFRKSDEIEEESIEKFGK